MVSVNSVTDERLLPGKWWYISVTFLVVLDFYLVLTQSPLALGLLIFPIYIFLLGMGVQQDKRSTLRQAS